MSTEKFIQTETSPSTLTTPKLNEGKHSGRVDINHLIARVRKEKSDENRSTLVFLSMLASLIIIVGIILSF
jgi:hypothetical protein|tara:strand:- start:367 stop:579 length:213 start_codon:yes stop_codon:yes gene_type:complete